MGLFGKLKNILFEDDDEVEEMPVYTKEEVKEEPVQEVKPVATPQPEVDEIPKLKNVKRDIDIEFPDDDVLGEVPGAFVPEVPKEEEIVQKEEVVKVEEKKSIFPSFDEAEFERLNARINHNESKATQREVVRRVDVPVNDNTQFARQANNNFSSTTVTEEQKDPDRYKINTGTIVNGKKPFTPSPVISPVYGILDKNYTKDDIVDRKGGLKRDGSNRNVVKKEITIEEAEEAEENSRTIDSIRKKAYGDEIELPKMEEKKEEKKDEKKEVEKPTKPSEEVYKEVEEEETYVDIPETPEVKEEIEEPSIEDQIEEEKFEAEPVDPELDSVIDEVIPEAKAEKVEKRKSRVLNDLEKTSTLKILDDIEKELNSIKPVSKEVEEKENEEIKEHEKTMDDTLENDLFNLIDSMYEDEGDEDDD